jgi:hypothetical protein
MCTCLTQKKEEKKQSTRAWFVLAEKKDLPENLGLYEASGGLIAVD